MKRIPKGWIYRQYPKPFEAIIEGPNYEVSDKHYVVDDGW
jgi:hypothetical protein